MPLALFDFDGTITNKDSFEDFIFFSHGRGRTLWGILLNSPILLAYLLKLVPNWQAKERIFAYFYGGWEIKKFNILTQQYIQQKLPRILRPAAIEKLKWHKKQGHTIVIVSASFENYLSVWCQQEEFALLATQLEINEGKFTGRFASKNCYGDEKVRRIKELFDLKSYDYIYAYGDSRGDLPLKTIANEFHYKPFRLR